MLFISDTGVHINMDINFSQIQFSTHRYKVEIPDWTIQSNQSWAVFSTEGDIGSVLGDLLCGESTPEQGKLAGVDESVAQVSLLEQQRLLEIELSQDDSDFLDRIDTGTTVETLIKQVCSSESYAEKLITDLDLELLRDSGFRILSTGETRRVMLARALASQPSLLVLDEPYTGLDVEHRTQLEKFLHTLSQQIQLLLIVSREDEIADWVDNIALFDQGKLVEQMDRESWLCHPVIAQIKSQSKKQSEQMVDLLHKHQHISTFPDPLFELTNGRVAYTDKVIFSQLNWCINSGEHWQIRGPNGCGKSTLLGLIFGDHPQCYSNQIDIFGNKRGSGETIWDIKQNIGMVSSALHLQYRVNCSALEVVLSGFYDSIGLYNQPSKRESNVAKEWLTILHMDALTKTPFRQLEYGQQRLLLIARALVKQPALLILDEPYQGLDYLGRRLVMNTLDIIAKENLSQLLYVSHYQEDSLQAITNYLDFVKHEEKDEYRVEISRQ